MDYTEGSFGGQLAGQDKFDVVFDFVGGTDVERNAKQILKQGGKFVTAVGPRQGVGDRVLTCSEWYGWACGITCRSPRAEALAVACSYCNRISNDVIAFHSFVAVLLTERTEKLQGTGTLGGRLTSLIYQI